jgi:L-ascorbate metabolism protein UlaG (beta-lactamase superfamily)
MEIRSLNNATTLVSDKDTSILIDPWLIGDPYAGAWSPYSKLKDLKFLNKITDVHQNIII